MNRLQATKSIPNSIVNASCAAIKHLSCHILFNNYIKQLYAYIIERRRKRSAERGDVCERETNNSINIEYISFFFSSWCTYLYWTGSSYIIIVVVGGVGGFASIIIITESDDKAKKKRNIFFFYFCIFCVCVCDCVYLSEREPEIYKEKQIYIRWIVCMQSQSQIERDKTTQSQCKAQPCRELRS